MEIHLYWDDGYSKSELGKVRMKMSDRSSTSSSSDNESEVHDKQGKVNIVTGTNQRTFRIPSHSDNVLQALNRQRANGEFCDITVLVEHQRFTAHKCVLSSSSSYFKGLLSNDNDGVFLRHVTADSFRSILDFMYTSKLQLDSTIVHDILAAAKFLQVRGVISICCRYLESQIRTLARDLDEHSPSTKNPHMISVDADFFKNQTSPVLQQPVAVNSYNPNLGTLAPEVVMASPRGQSIFGHPDQQVAQPQILQQHAPQQLANFIQPTTTSVMPVNFSNSVEMPAQNGFFVPNNATSHQILQQPTTFPQTQVFVPEQQQTTHAMNPQPQSQTVWQNPNHSPVSVFPYQTRRTSLTNHTNHTNPFGSPTVPRDQLPLPPIMSKRTAPPTHIYSSQSTGGKGRRPHLQPRRRANHAAVSKTNTFRFTFPQPTTLPATSTPKPPQAAPPSGGNCPPNHVMLLSSARVAKGGKYRSGTPETAVFDIEAEDRYWDALSTPRQ